jgi:hypothetical protein
MHVRPARVTYSADPVRTGSGVPMSRARLASFPRWAEQRLPRAGLRRDGNHRYRVRGSRHRQRGIAQIERAIDTPAVKDRVDTIPVAR